MSNALIEKIKKNSKIKELSILTNSKVLEEKKLISTDVYAMNIALSGDMDGGFTNGLTMFAGPSKHFKTSFTLLLISTYLKKYPDSVCIYYDNEFGSPKSYFKQFDIDTDRVVHIPFTNIEELKTDIMNQMAEKEKNDKIIFAIDSIGNAASIKEINDAKDDKQVADMTRAKSLKSLFRMITPNLSLKNIPLIVINHTYKEQSLFPKDIVSGGTGGMYSSDNIFIVGRQQEKDGTAVIGYNFILNVEKSRFIKEKSKIPIEVTYDGGINKYSGLIDLALEFGFVVKPTKGYYAKVDINTGEVEEKRYRLSETNSACFWDSILTNDLFNTKIKNKYKLGKKEEIDETE